MKKQLLHLIFIIVFFLSPLFTLRVAADEPPNPGGGPGGGDIPVGGGSPVGSGLVVLLSLATAYGTKKVFELRKKD